jgi:hypothetical protein
VPEEISNLTAVLSPCVPGTLKATSLYLASIRRRRLAFGASVESRLNLGRFHGPVREHVIGQNAHSGSAEITAKARHPAPLIPLGRGIAAIMTVFMKLPGAGWLKTASADE